MGLLCNYSTHVLYHLPNLVSLDGVDTSSKPVKDISEVCRGLLKITEISRDTPHVARNPKFPDFKYLQGKNLTINSYRWTIILMKIWKYFSISHEKITLK